MSEPGQNKVAGAGDGEINGGDTRYTKIFVGGLAWETKTDGLKRYFDQFGEISEAVVIHDKATGRSKGYGFVTFKDVDSAMRACRNQSPVIDGRRTNCNLASLGGSQKNRQIPVSQSGNEKFSPPPPPPRVMPPYTAATPAFYRQLVPQYAFPYSAYRYPGYTQNIPAMYYYGGQPFPSGSPGVYYFPVYQQHGQRNPNQYPKTNHYPHSSQQYQPFRTTSHPPTASSSAPDTPQVAGMPGTTDTTQNNSS